MTTKIKQSDINKFVKANFDYGFVKQYDDAGNAKVATIDGKRVSGILTGIQDSPMDVTSVKYERLNEIKHEVASKLVGEFGGNVVSEYGSLKVELPNEQVIYITGHKIRSYLSLNKDPDYKTNYITAIIR